MAAFLKGRGPVRLLKSRPWIRTLMLNLPNQLLAGGTAVVCFGYWGFWRGLQVNHSIKEEEDPSKGGSIPTCAFANVDVFCLLQLTVNMQGSIVLARLRTHHRSRLTTPPLYARTDTSQNQRQRTQRLQSRLPETSSTLRRSNATMQVGKAGKASRHHSVPRSRPERREIYIPSALKALA
jgi:hypothetical protein